MAGAYGMTFAARLIEQGKYEEAIAEATRAVAQDEDNPEPLFERASALAWLERYAEAAGDFEQALALDADAGLLDGDVVDDAYFSALLGVARQEQAVDEGVRWLERYRDHLPSGRHLQDVVDWAKRLKGELKSEHVKARL